MINYVKKGDVITVAAAVAVSSGGFVVLEDRAVIACETAATGENLETLWEGVVSLTKEGVAINAGEKLYCDFSNSRVTNDDVSGANKPIGWAAQTTASSVTTTLVKLGAF